MLVDVLGNLKKTCVAIHPYDHVEAAERKEATRENFLF
jgi:hypothetical protein